VNGHSRSTRAPQPGINEAGCSGAEGQPGRGRCPTGTKASPCCEGGNETSLPQRDLAEQSRPQPALREATQPREVPPAHLVGMISLDVPEGAGGRLAQGTASQGGLQHRLLHQQRLRLCQGLLDDDGGGHGRGAGGGSCLRHRLFLHLHFGVVEILLPLPLVRVCTVPAGEERVTTVKGGPVSIKVSSPPTSSGKSDLALRGRAALLPGSKASH